MTLRMKLLTNLPGRQFKSTLIFTGLWISLVALSSLAQGQIVSTFEKQTQELDEVGSGNFPGTPGDGWQDAWKVRRYLAGDNKSSNRIEGIVVVETSIATMPRAVRLQPLPDRPDVGVGISRAYESTPDLDINQPYRIALQVFLSRVPDKKASPTDAYIFIGENGTDAVNPTSGTTWMLQGFMGASSKNRVVTSKQDHVLYNARQSQWNLVDAPAGSESPIYFPTGIVLEQGRLYSIEILINPSDATYRCLIQSDGQEFISDVLHYDDSRPLGRNLVIGSRYPAGNSFELLVGNIRIEAAPWN
jgi:hypothetical protein